ncbi:dipeptide ABC transporter ATP-binding protein [Enemella evansiae]|uniref:Dipeptide ABC transporter ATP-binding protein n=1 Tax=Enemella evansiae TaxID=2016499 RepID=A0A255GLL8_9ACTN|nr:ABC transporter ATP-binding protein [Enemella evansiae]OYO16727.1 dipeptide ABC transporter ATP-binding protein [Enemella evansiae]OYO19564.1 dipeptide ABC transporter ATP-binding protein [Enemella evansiae]
MTDPSPQPLLALDGLTVDIALRRGAVHALRGVDLTVDPGEIIGVVGESGSGKTMTALSIMGLLPSGGRVTDGSITVAGRDITRLTPAESRRIRGTEIGMIFQDPLTSLNPTLKIGNQVAEPLRIHEKANRAEGRDRAIEILRRVGMPRAEKIVDDYPHQLSGGMRQRVMIAMALVCSPKLLIADEPTTALDVTTQRQILDLIDEIRAEFGTAVMLVTHDLGVVAGRADKVAVMYAGRIVESAPAVEIFADPRHQYTRALLGAVPDHRQDRGQRLLSIPGMPPNLARPITGCSFAPRCPAATSECEQDPGEQGTPQHRFFCHHPHARPEQDRRPTPPAVVEVTEGSAATEPAHPAALLRLSEISKIYPAMSGTVLRRRSGEIHAVSDVSLTVARGETLGIVGESGCGKSTLGRMIARLEQPTSGAMEFDGAVVGDRDSAPRSKRLHRRIQLMFQDSYAAMDPRMRVDEILTEPLAIQRIGTARERAAQAGDLLDSVGLARTSLERYPHEFSGGQLQRVGLARALALKPDLVVCDEPVSALDVSVQAQVLNLMRDLQNELGLAYVFISHDLSVVRYMADRIAVMYLGKIVEIGAADQVVTNPLHPYTRALIDAIPSVADIPETDQSVEEQPEIIGEPADARDPGQGCRFAARCPRAQQLCRSTEPPLRGDGHQVACHFPLAEVRGC